MQDCSPQGHDNITDETRGKSSLSAYLVLAKSSLLAHTFLLNKKPSSRPSTKKPAINSSSGGGRRHLGDQNSPYLEGGGMKDKEHLKEWV